MSTRIAIAFTGGIDSTVLAYWLRDTWISLHGELLHELHLMVANYQQASFQKSWELAGYHRRKLNQTSVGATGRIVLHQVTTPMLIQRGKDGLLKEGYVPPQDNPSRDDYSKPSRAYDYAHIQGRNATIFQALMTRCLNEGIPLLYTGYQYEPLEWDNLDAYRHRVCDAGPNLTDRMNILQEVGFIGRVRIENPFITFKMSKMDIIKLGHKYGIDIETETYSCQFYPKCGKCENCQNLRDVLIELAGGSRDAPRKNS